MAKPKVLMQLLVHPETVQVEWDQEALAELLQTGDIKHILDVLATEITRQAERWKSLHQPKGPVN